MKHMSGSVQFLGATTVFEGKRFQVSRDRFATADGEQERAIIHHPGSVAILAQAAPGQLLLVRQYRYALQRETLEIPAGTRSPDEEPIQTAARELIEETGYRAGRLEQLCCLYPSIGICDELQYFFKAFDLEPAQMNPDAGEFVEPIILDQAGITQAVAAGDICDTKTILALQLIGFDVAGIESQNMAAQKKAVHHVQGLT